MFGILKKNFIQVQKNQIDLDIKQTKYQPLQPALQVHQIPKIIYDSDWINPGQDDGTIISGNHEIYFQYLTDTTLIGQRTPFRLYYHFHEKIRISENYLSSIYPSIMVSTQPETILEGAFLWQPYSYSSSFWKIYGDATKIYEGMNPSTTLWEKETIDLGQISTNLTGRWYYGTIEFTADGNHYKLQDGYMDSVKTWYDVVPLSGHPGFYSYKIFECPAIDSLSSSSVTGTGTYTIVTASEDIHGNAQRETIIIKNKTMSAPMFQDNVVIRASGSLYKNSEFQQFYFDYNPYQIVFSGTFIYSTASLISFSYNWDSINGMRKLFYSTKRAKQFRFNTGLRELQNLPIKTNYETETLPYNILSVKQNPDNYPTIRQGEFPNVPAWHGGVYFYWTKLDTNYYEFHVTGNLLLSAPSNRNVGTFVRGLDEQYTPKGNTYEFNENRYNKNMPLYKPMPSGIQIRCMISFLNPKQFSETLKYKV